MYMKFFPEFTPEEIFKDINWKNNLEDFMAKSRNQINYMIQQD